MLLIQLIKLFLMKFPQQHCYAAHDIWVEALDLARPYDGFA